MKAVGNKGVIGDKMSASRTFCAAVHKDHLSSSSHLEKTRGPYAAQSPYLISLLCPRAAGTQIVTPSVPQLKVFGLSASSCCQSAAVTSSSRCRNPFAVCCLGLP